MEELRNSCLSCASLRRLQYPSTRYTKTLAGLLQKFLGDGQIDQSGIDIFWPKYVAGTGALPSSGESTGKAKTSFTNARTTGRCAWSHVQSGACFFRLVV
jgi:hypothetical protein